MSLSLRIRVRVGDETGKIIHDTGTRPSGSFVGQFLKILDAFLFAAVDLTGVTAPNIPGTVILYSSGTTVPGSTGDLDEALYLNGDMADDLTGIVIGAGDQAENLETDTALQTRYTASSFQPHKHHQAEDEDATEQRIIFSRAFTNVSGGSLPVREIGIQAYDYATLWYRAITGYQTYYPYLPITQLVTTRDDWWGLAARDVISTLQVPAGGFISIEYEIAAPK